MQGAKILLLENPEQLIALPKLHTWEPKKLLWSNSIKPGEIPTKEQLEQLYMPNWCYLDFEKLAEDYDAIELQNHWFFNSSLVTWWIIRRNRHPFQLKWYPDGGRHFDSIRSPLGY